MVDITSQQNSHRTVRMQTILRILPFSLFHVPTPILFTNNVSQNNLRNASWRRISLLCSSRYPHTSNIKQFRSNWVVDPQTGEYSASIPSPTGIPSDPALAGYGVDQAHELAAHLAKIEPPIQRVYSSPFYRCIQTIAPTVASLNKDSANAEGKGVNVRLENGIGEWYGTARFDHPSPATPSLLSTLFPPKLIDTSYEPSIIPSTNGESIRSLHERCAYALHHLIEQSDREGVEAICICTHAASLIAIGRVLVGRMPESIEEEDFRPFTCGVSVFQRKDNTCSTTVEKWQGAGSQIPRVEWEGGSGVGGGWNMTVSGDCSFLSGGEERGWRFSGDESFHSNADKAAGLDAGSGLGVVIEGRKGSVAKSDSRL